MAADDGPLFLVHGNVLDIIFPVTDYVLFGAVIRLREKR